MDQWLHEYVKNRSQEAFAALVRQYADLVYASARRSLGDRALAEDVTQAVFILLAEKAGTIRRPGLLAGWLLRTTHYAACNARRLRKSRHFHEQRAAAMRDERVEPSEAPAWETYAPAVDEAMARLGEVDRSAIAMRYLQGLSLREVGEALGLSEEAARKRVDRALSKLRDLLARKVAVPSAAGLAVALPANAVEAAPHGLTEAAIAASSGNAAGAAGLIAKGAAKSMLWAKMKAGAIVAAVAVATGGLGIGVHALRNPATTAVAAVPNGVDSASTERLKNGVVVELVGLAPNPSDGKRWWRPDGETLAKAPYARAAVTTSRDEQYTPIEMAIRLSVPADVDEDQVTLTPALAGYWVAVRRQDERPELYTLAGGAPVADRTGILRIRIAAGAWMPMAQLSPLAASAMADTPAGNVELREAGETDRGATLTAVLPVERHDREVQVVAVDALGKAHLPTGEDSRTEGKTRTASMRFALPLAQVREFRARYRPYDGWVEYRNLALAPGVTTKVEVLTSDGADTLTKN